MQQHITALEDRQSERLSEAVARFEGAIAALSNQVQTLATTIAAMRGAERKSESLWALLIAAGGAVAGAIAAVFAGGAK